MLTVIHAGMDIGSCSCMLMLRFPLILNIPPANRLRKLDSVKKGYNFVP